jgi:hypothetical protein
MNRFISSLLFAFTILTGTASFAQSSLPAERSAASPAIHSARQSVSQCAFR